MKTNWPVKKLGEIVEIKGGKRLPLGHRFSETITKYPYIRVVDFKNYSVDSEHLKYISEETYTNISRYTISSEDIYISIAGTIGLVGIIPRLFHGANLTENAAKLAIRDKNNLEAKYLMYYLTSYEGKKQIETKTNKVGQPKLALMRIASIEIPIPPIGWQRKIISKLEKMLEVKKLANEQLSNVDSLFNSICKTFFKKIEEKSKNVPLNTVCEVVKGKFPTLKTKGGKYPFVVTAEGRKDADSFQFDTEAVCVPLISSTGHGHADIKRIHYQEGKFALANIMAALISKDRKELEPKYLYYYLSFYKDRLLVTLMQGGANVTIPIDSLKFVKILLPPSSDQLKLIKMLLRVEELKKDLLDREKLLYELEQSALHRAFKGEL